MSRIGKKTIEIPAGVTVTVKDGKVVVKGPKGEITKAVNAKVKITVEDNHVSADVVNKEEKSERSLWGTFGSHLKNMVTGVTTGFKKQLEINGVGYKASMAGADLRLDVGFSHPVIFKVPTGIKISVEKNLITVEGFDKEQVGQIAACIRDVKKPEPYKGKGIKYIDEIIRRKAGKTASK